jgi:hypothetical protein
VTETLSHWGNNVTSAIFPHHLEGNAVKGGAGEPVAPGKLVLSGNGGRGRNSDLNSDSMRTLWVISKSHHPPFNPVPVPGAATPYQFQPQIQTWCNESGL